MGPARVEGRLYHLGRYPGMRLAKPRQLQADEWVSGEIYRLRSPAETLKALDLYEGASFRLVLIKAAREGGNPIFCWCYEYTKPVAEELRIRSGDYLDIE